MILSRVKFWLRVYNQILTKIKTKMGICSSICGNTDDTSIDYQVQKRNAISLPSFKTEEEDSFQELGRWRPKSQITFEDLKASWVILDVP